MKKLRLLFTSYCPRQCVGCCNKDWDLKNLLPVTHFNYDEILITGGEPLYDFKRILGFLQALRVITKAKIYIYTAYVTNEQEVARILQYCDGITLTLHDQSDVLYYDILCKYFITRDIDVSNKSLRLNVFRGIKVNPYPNWVVKSDIEWVENCPLPKDEEFKKLY